ncbi:P-loop containing nucleoside triphosphate hydrolase [Fusarium albosuccineum]|uniref:P-loop containing nucleoside triphosphate hydrolase n=1 Tax=Fusarium albosuccineum TaxID=1237068 RepID=A0A8H4L4S8_9HYPO|nr:P-loop containing nucleoside triphosphate hydrolase [Fusarium albosuccineum]
MDPFAAIGLAGNIIAFVDFGFKVVNAAREFKDSASGNTAENEHLKFLTTQIQGLTLTLQNDKLTSDMTLDEQRLDNLVKECQSLSEDLLKLLQTLQVKSPNKKSKREAFGAVFRNLRKKDDKDDLVTRLERCKQQLHLQLSHMTRLDTKAKFATIINSGKCHESELQQLSQHVDTLRNGVQVTSLGPDLLADIRRLLNLTDDAMNKVVQNTILEALKQDRMGDRYDAVEDAYENTFDWLFHDQYQSDDESLDSQPVIDQRQKAREIFLDWLSRGDGIFHVHGKPGAGKSTLMKYICESNRTFQLLNDWAGTKRLVFAKFFFWRYGTEVQKSWDGLLRSLLFSVVSECPHLIESTFPKQWQSIKDSKPCHLSATDIQHSFTNLMKRNDVFDEHKFAFLIDGLDEFVGRDDKMITSLFSWIDSWPTDIKICVSSRELPIFQQRFQECPKLRVHELTEPDMKILVDDSLQKNPDVKAMAESARLEISRLGDILVEQAEGVFLWLSLALKTLEEGILLEDSIHDLAEKINSLPKEVEELFSVIFEMIKTDIHPLDRERALRTLGFVTASSDPSFTISQLEASFLDDYGDDESFADSMNITIDVEERQNRLRRCRKQIEGRCRGLLSIVERPGWSRRFDIVHGDIELTHRSLVEYFGRPDVMAYLEPYSQPIGIANFKCQAALAELKCAGGYFSRYKFNRRCKAREQNELFQPHNESEEELMSNERLCGPTRSYQYMVNDLCRALYLLGPLDSSLIMRMLQPLNLFAEKHLDSPSFEPAGYTLDYYFRKVPGPRQPMGRKSCKSWASFHCPLKAASLGMYDLSKAMGDDRRFLERYLAEDSSDLSSLVQYHIDMVLRAEAGRTREFLRAMLGCLELGASPQSRAWQGFTGPIPSLWQLAVWSFFTNQCILLPGPFLLALVIYGADTFVWLEFDASQERMLDGDDIYFRFLFGSGRKKPFRSFPIDRDVVENIQLLEMAQKSDWRLSFRQILEFWCPSNLHKFDKLAELRTSRGDKSLDVSDIKGLKKQCGLDVEDWNESEWTLPKRLLTPKIPKDREASDYESSVSSSDHHAVFGGGI